MRPITLFLVACIFSLMVSGQVNDNFSDGDLTQNPQWLGNTGSFSVNASKQLQLDTIGAGVKYLSTANQLLIDIEWEFWVKLGFDPSANNNLKIYLASDQKDLTGALNGYFIRIGENLALDDIDLVRQNGTTETLIIDGIDGHAAKSPTLRIKVKHFANGNWELWSDTLGGTKFIQEGTGNDNSIISSSWCGVVCKFTTSNSKNFFFDDFYIGTERKDTIGPKLTELTVVDYTTLLVRFDEEIDTNSLLVSNFYGINFTISKIEIISLTEIKLYMWWNTSVDYSNQKILLWGTGIKDLAGNSVGFATEFIYFFAHQNDFLINELMPDPSPPVGLPESEFVELYSRLDVNFPLAGMTISDGITTATFTSDSIPAKGFVILCHASDTGLFSGYGKTISCSLPSLNNTSDYLILKSDKKIVIDSIHYNTDWYHNDSKKDGGWSLELINPITDCRLAENRYTASMDAKGGTPGSQNSVFDPSTDTIAPEVLFFNLKNDSTVSVTINEQFNNPIASVLKVKVWVNSVPDTTFSVANIDLTEPDKVNITFKKKFIRGEIYKVRFDGIADCRLNKTSFDTLFVIPFTVDSSDLLINEVLFNPFTGSYDFVEIINPTNKILSMKGLKLANLDDSLKIYQPKVLFKTDQLIFPEDYVVFTENPEDIKFRYDVQHEDLLYKISDLPSFNDDEGWVVLLDSNGKVIDEMKYSEKMHFPLLNDVEGVSLERVSSKVSSINPSNWHSASSTVGYATPTYKNSQADEISGPFIDPVSVFPQVFSPDNDGNDDYVQIKYVFPTEENYGRVAVFDLAGRQVRTITENSLLGTEGFFTWDGLDKDNQKLPSGVYIIYFETVSLNGITRKFKLPVTLAVKK